jgi:hypothetical protein
MRTSFLYYFYGKKLYIAIGFISTDVYYEKVSYCYTGFVNFSD